MIENMYFFSEAFPIHNIISVNMYVYSKLYIYINMYAHYIHTHTYSIYSIYIYIVLYCVVGKLDFYGVLQIIAGWPGSLLAPVLQPGGLQWPQFGAFHVSGIHNMYWWTGWMDCWREPLLETRVCWLPPHVSSKICFDWFIFSLKSPKPNEQRPTHDATPRAVIERTLIAFQVIPHI